MKKITLLMLACLSVSLGINAQSSLSHNQMASSGKGYLFEFKGTAANNCPAKIPYDQWNIPSAYAVQSIGSDTMVVTTDGTQQGWHRLNMKLTSGTCTDDVAINLKDNQNITMVIKSSVAVPQCILWLADINGNIADNNPIVQALNVGVNTITVTDLDFKIYNTSNYIDSTQIFLIGLTFRKSYDDNDGGAGASPSVIGTFKVASITIGDQTGIVSSINAPSEKLQSTITVAPSPASTSMRVSFESEEVTTVSLQDMMGKTQIVKNSPAGQQTLEMNIEALPKGIYSLTIKSGEALATKKVVIE